MYISFFHDHSQVGRTGTFLALYKLWLDYKNENVRLDKHPSLNSSDAQVKSLAILPIVLEMRHQRCKTVQRAAQYVYIAKCLRSLAFFFFVGGVVVVVYFYAFLFSLTR